MNKVKLYFIHVFTGFDQFVTTIIGGWPDETLSSYAYRMNKQNKPWGRIWMPIIDWMFSWQNLPHGHCFAAYEEERLRIQTPLELR